MGIKVDVIFFIVMFLVAFSVDPMNMMVYSLDDLYVSKSLVISSLFMASNMLWAHQIVHYLSRGHLSKIRFFIGSIKFLFIFPN